MLTIVLLFLSLLTQPAQPTACVDASAYADAQAALTAAQSGPRCLYLPSGVYPVGVGLQAAADGLEIRGDGIGLTILETSVPTPTVALYAVSLGGTRQHLHDLTIRGTQRATSGVKVTGSNATIERVEVTGLFSAAGIETYAPAATPTQIARIAENSLHDLSGNGLLIDSSGNTIEGNTIARVGASALYHGMYIQGGDNRIVGNRIEQASGYSLQGWHYVPNMDGSGNRYDGNLSIDPGVGHMVIGGVARSTTISGNTFRNTNSSQSAGIDARTPVIVSGNTFEDVSKSGAAIIGLSQAAGGSVVSGNRVLAKTPYPGYGARFGILLDAPALVSDNTVDMAELPWGIVARVGKGQIVGNRVTSTVGYSWQTAIKVDAADTVVSQNIIDLPAGVGIGGAQAPARASDNLVWIAGVAK